MDDFLFQKDIWLKIMKEQMWNKYENTWCLKPIQPFGCIFPTFTQDFKW